jgi:hypothetical protein
VTIRGLEQKKVRGRQQWRVRTARKRTAVHTKYRPVLLARNTLSHAQQTGHFLEVEAETDLGLALHSLSYQIQWLIHQPSMSNSISYISCFPLLLAGKSEDKRPVGGPRRRWTDNIKMRPKRKRVLRCVLDSSTLGESNDGLLWNFGFHEGRGNYWLAERLLASQKGL